MDSPETQFEDRLRLLRERQIGRLSPFRASQQCGYSRNLWKRWEKGEHEPKLEAVQVIGRYFALDPAEFYWLVCGARGPGSRGPPSVDDGSFGKRLRRLRRERAGELDERTAAGQCGFSRQAWIYWEAGEHRPRVYTLEKMAVYFGLSAAGLYWLVYGDCLSR